ncbi:hypothetical protein Apa02nite_061620 [Actinoplanes palleronii]|uniref:PH domain-containing protein n=2 Tax=Actinoplanes palleronii TaxID=113570 RepID=A0ABQ4BH92_9ACTN|nr:hypothetical protein Apa02nite_061620 [Actinoplanes palleronii]
MGEWRAPYPRTVQQYVGVFLVVFGILFTVVAGTTAVIARAPVLAMLAGAAFIALWLTMVFRIGWAGLYLGDDGVLVRGPLRTHRFTRTEIAAVAVAPAEVFGLVTARPAIWLVLRDGRRVEVPVQRRPDRVGFGSVTKNAGPVLRPDIFDAAVTAVRDHLARGPG